MPHRKVLNRQETSKLLDMPEEREVLEQFYTFSDEEQKWTDGFEGDVNRLGFGVQLALMKYPGAILGSDWVPSRGLVRFVAEQLGVSAKLFQDYPVREQTRLDHCSRIQELLKVRKFSEKADQGKALAAVADVAIRTDHGATIVRELIAHCRKSNLLLPTLKQLEELAGKAITQGEKKIYATLTSSLSPKQCRELRALLEKKREGRYELTWLTQTVEVPSAENILGHIERLRYIRTFELPDSIRECVHEERLEKMADIASKSHITVQRDHNPTWQLAELVAVALVFEKRITDEILSLHGKMIGRMHNRAKTKYKEKKLADAEAMRGAVLLLPKLLRILNKCRDKEELPFAAIEKVISWEGFQRLVDDIEERTEGDSAGPLLFVDGSYNQIHEYARPLLQTLEFYGAPAVKDVVDAVEATKRMHQRKVDLRKLPPKFVPPKWEPLVFPDSGPDPKFYELCALTRLNECLESGDIWVKRSYRYRDFEDLLISRQKFESIKASGKLPIAIEPNCEKYLKGRLEALDASVKRVEELAKNGLLEGVTVGDSKITIAAHERDTPMEAKVFSQDLYDLVPRVKITDALLELDLRYRISDCFLDYRDGIEAPDLRLLHAALLAEGLNLSSEKMAQACSGFDDTITTARLDGVKTWCLRPEAFKSAMSLILDLQKKLEISKYWGDASTSSSDGQRFRTTGHAYDLGTSRPNYGSEPGVSFYTHVSDLWLPFHTTAIAGADQEVAYILDGHLYSKLSNPVREHYTDTAGFSDLVFAFTHLFGYVFAARVRKFSKYSLHLPPNMTGISALQPMIGDALDLPAIIGNWDEMLRAGTSVQRGTVRASEFMVKLSSYRRQNRLAHALVQFGRIERSLFMLRWMSEPDFRRTVHRCLNKGEAVHALTRTVASIGRAGEIRDRNREMQIRRANGFQFLVAVISLWNSLYLDRAFKHLKSIGEAPKPDLLSHVAPLGCEHILLTGDYIWPSELPATDGRYRPLRNIL